MCGTGVSLMGYEALGKQKDMFVKRKGSYFNVFIDMFDVLRSKEGFFAPKMTAHGSIQVSSQTLGAKGAPWVHQKT